MASVVKTVTEKKGTPPEERPDLYDAYDCQERPPLSEEYLNAVRPEHVKTALALKKAAKGGKPQ
jgi:hypothetical protein